MSRTAAYGKAKFNVYIAEKCVHAFRHHLVCTSRSDVPLSHIFIHHFQSGRVRSCVWIDRLLGPADRVLAQMLLHAAHRSTVCFTLIQMCKAMVLRSYWPTNTEVAGASSSLLEYLNFILISVTVDSN